MAGKVKFTAKPYKKITLDDMCDFIEEHYPEDKKWFKEVAYQDKDGNDIGRYNHLVAVRRFCERYNKDLLPVAKEKPVPATKRLADW